MQDELVAVVHTQSKLAVTDEITPEDLLNIPLVLQMCIRDRVYAPEGILDTITTAYTQKINLENISDTTRRRIPLNSERGVKFVQMCIRDSVRSIN